MASSDPTYSVIKYVRDMLHRGELKPGDKLPAERKLAEEIGVGRTHVRNALQRLEFYGIIKTYPQSGSVVAALNMQALEGLIADVLKIDTYDFRSLVQMRVALEALSARLCAENRTEQDIEAIEKASEDFLAHFDGPQRVDKDFIFHRTIARGSHNPVLCSMLLIITPDILHFYNKHRVCTVASQEIIDEHYEIVESIRAKDPDRAERIVRAHLANLEKFSKEIVIE